MTQHWLPFLRWFLISFVALLALAFGFIALVNPFGNLPVSIGLSHVILDQDQRYHYPAMAASGAFDSAIFGTSSSRLLEPARLSELFGGRFANFALNDGHAWEQLQLANVYLRATPSPRTVVFALDWVWCYGDAVAEGAKRAKTFPVWLYDDTRWNDWLYVLNTHALKASIRRLRYAAGLKARQIDGDGYGVFVPRDDQYDAVKARAYIWEGRTPSIPPSAPDYQPTQADLAAWSFPALHWLEGLLTALPRETVKVLAFMPAHIAIQPAPGSPEAGRIKLCKAKIAEMARHYGAHYLDFWIRSPITVEDGNFWDPRHYRLPIAARLADDIGLAVAGKRRASEDFIYQSP
ncbi:MAG TPA: hypothetical protein VNS34_04165 [Rhizobiaceae bacterium]|nr:hypothetical protein [Rhizobiaceae bacterium]